MKYDVAVIGSGPGGYVAAIRAAQLGMKVVCIEKEKTLGGTCLNVGCIPSKALLSSSSHYEWLLKSANDHGISAENPRFDFQKMQKRKEEVVKSHVDGIAFLFQKNKIEKIIGEAVFVSPHEVQVGERVIETDNFIIATGGEPSTLLKLPFDEKRVVSSTGALALQEVPKKLIVIGAGVIGVEISSIYKRLGSEVIVLEMLDYICPGMDRAISNNLLQVLKRQGIAFHLGAKVTNVKVENGNVAITFITQEKEEQISGDILLVAVGRKPFTKGLQLEKAGVKLNEKGFIEVDANFRTSINHIYAIGDVIEGPLLAHRAMGEAFAVAEIIAGLTSHVNYLAIPNVVYTHPEAAAVGMTEEEAKSAGLQINVGSTLFRANSYARCVKETDGMVKIVGEKSTDRLIGLHILGANASEMIAEGVLALEKKATITDIAYASHAHPTMSESIKEAALNALGRAIHF